MPRRYTKHNLVKNTVLDYMVTAPDGTLTTTHTAKQIAEEHMLLVRSVRRIACIMGIKMKPDKRGGLRNPCNQHKKK